MYAIDADHLTVRIEPFDGTVSYRAGVLCRRHADAMVVPLGWTLDDQRESMPRLFKPKEPPAPQRVKPKRSRQHQRDETGQLELGVVPDDDEDEPISPMPATRPDDAAAAWKPVFDQSDDLGGLLAVESPLLSRAFGRRERPHDDD